jgi:hypothetical protein
MTLLRARKVSADSSPLGAKPILKRVPVPRKLLLTLLALTALAVTAGSATYAAFSGTTSSTGNAFSAGSVSLSDDDSDTALLSLSGAKPGNSDTGCIRVTYTGSLDATVRIYATLAGALAPYLDVTVTRGTDPSPSFDSCAGFTADGTNYIGQGPGVIYSGTLAAFPSNWAGGVVDPTSASPATWSTSTSRSYRISVSLQNDPAAQGLSGSASFTWEARNQ